MCLMSSEIPIGIGTWIEFLGWCQVAVMLMLDSSKVRRVPFALRLTRLMSQCRFRFHFLWVFLSCGAE
jgi:hypothetical protein